MLTEFWVYWTYFRICVLDIDHNYQSCTGIERDSLASAVKLNLSELTTLLQRTCTKRNSGKYIKDDVTVLLVAGKSWMSCKNSSINYVSMVQVRCTKWLFNSSTGILSRSWVEKNCLRRWILIYFKRIGLIGVQTNINYLSWMEKRDLFTCNI